MLPPVDRQDDNVVVDDAKVHRVRKPAEDGAPRFPAHESKLHRVIRDAFERFFESCAKLGTKPEPPTFVPVSRFKGLGFSLRPEADAMPHSRSRSFRRTSSHGMADSGR